ncbi:MAG: hypothetical protein PGN16_03840 [Sphingomonas phyllosphaerae]|uniref:hypothetical protein n=1 Tax=Sphingomonas phyllosphaerae TaxID=257003 RepID=UPI002FFB35DB
MAEVLPGAKPLQPLPDRLRMRAVLMQRGRGNWRVGTGALTVGAIERDLVVYATEIEAHEAAIRLADRLDLLAVRT